MQTNDAQIPEKWISTNYYIDWGNNYDKEFKKNKKNSLYKSPTHKQSLSAQFLSNLYLFKNESNGLKKIYLIADPINAAFELYNSCKKDDSFELCRKERFKTIESYSQQLKAFSEFSNISTMCLSYAGDKQTIQLFQDIFKENYLPIKDYNPKGLVEKIELASQNNSGVAKYLN
jgi:hypothetical protein